MGMTSNGHLTYQEAVKWFRLDLRNGEIIWRRTPAHATHCEGQVAGGYDYNGRRVVRLHGRQYQAARLVYLLYHGRWPVGKLYHENGHIWDNRLCNLKERR